VPIICNKNLLYSGSASVPNKSPRIQDTKSLTQLHLSSLTWSKVGPVSSGWLCLCLMWLRVQSKLQTTSSESQLWRQDKIVRSLGERVKMSSLWQWSYRSHVSLMLDVSAPRVLSCSRHIQALVLANGVTLWITWFLGNVEFQSLCVSRATSWVSRIVSS